MGAGLRSERSRMTPPLRSPTPLPNAARQTTNSLKLPDLANRPPILDKLPRREGLYVQFPEAFPQPSGVPRALLGASPQTDRPSPRAAPAALACFSISGSA